MSDDTVAIKVEHLTKSFRIPLEQSSGLKQKLINTLKGRKGYRNFTPLNDISFEINKGEFFGIVGRNGSGKSTLLKSIAGIYTPNSGGVHVSGKLVPFIELGVGFNAELSGRENVYLNGALLGFSRDEMDAMYHDIVSFAELEDFMEERLKNYSSGMQVRLAFSIAIRAEGDILLLDEVLAVGDESFQRKCYNYFAQLKNDKKTVILVTHSMSSAQEFCDRVMLVDNGEIVKIGDPSEVADLYRKLNSDKVEKDIHTEENSQKFVALESSYKKEDSRIHFDMKFTSKIDIPDAVVAFIIHKKTGEWIYRWVSDEGRKGEVWKPGDVFNLHLDIDDIFADGGYFVSAIVKKADRTAEYLDVKNALEFDIVSTGNDRYWKPQTNITYERGK